MASTKRRSRRTLLGGLLAATGLAGSGLAAKFAPWGAGHDSASTNGSAPPVAELVSATLYLDRYTLHTGSPGPERHKGDQSLLRGTLLTETGERAGELFASAITMPGPIDEGSPHTARLEMQSLLLNDGTILAMGTVFGQSDIPNVYTVIGGTGSYAGTRGTYQFDENPNVARPDGRARISLALTIEGGVSHSPGRQL